ncbi:HNH endonuclease [Mucilaginibacter sp.]
MTKVEAIKRVLLDHNGVANWSIIYSEITKYYPEAKRSIEWQAGIRGVLYRSRDFKRINNGIISLAEYDETLQVLDEDKPLLTEVSVEALIRIGQSKFRDNLLKREPKCPITGIKDKRLLNASHIKPWAICNNRERMDVCNGFIFSPLIDRLFDRFLISFKNDKTLIISSSLSNNDISSIGLEAGRIYKNLPIHNKESYLDFHRGEFDRLQSMDN